MKKPNKTGHEQVHAREISELHRGACQSGLRCKNWERTENFGRSRIWLAIGKRFMVTNQAHPRCGQVHGIVLYHALPKVFSSAQPYVQTPTLPPLAPNASHHLPSLPAVNPL